MKKLLLASVALSGLAFAAPAHAEIELEVGGYFKGYGVFVDQDEAAGSDDVNSFDFVRDTEIHLGGETTLDNGLTVGAHFEFDVDGDDNTAVDESYVYFSGNWGRVNFGEEDGAAYLLQVAAPSADSNVDGIRQYIQPLNPTSLGITGFTDQSLNLDYAQDQAKDADKLTYLSPIFSGFQVGLSYAPDSDRAGDVEGAGTDANVANEVDGATYELAARYEGQFQNVGVIAGAGYTHGEEEGNTAGTDDRTAWNVGLDLDIGPFGIGASYSEDDRGEDAAGTDDTEILVIGADYTTGPFKIGASYYNNDVNGTLEVDRYTGGVNYEYGPGMSFRGSISFTDVENGSEDADGTAVLLGTQIKF